MCDRLVEIEQESWPILKELYKPDDKKNFISHMSIGNYISRFERDPNEQIKFLCLNGDFLDGSFVLTASSLTVISNVDHYLSLLYDHD